MSKRWRERGKVNPPTSLRDSFVQSMVTSAPTFNADSSFLSTISAASLIEGTVHNTHDVAELWSERVTHTFWWLPSL